MMLPLIRLFPPLMMLALLCIGILLIYNFREFFRASSLSWKKAWAVLGLIFILGLEARLLIVSHTHLVYDDEYVHVNVAQNILYGDRFCQCGAGTNEQCDSCWLIPWPPGYHVFLSLLLGLFGDAEQVVFNANAILGSLSVLLVFFLFYLKTGHTFLSLAAAFLFCLIPPHLRFSGSASLCIFSIFGILLHLTCLELFVKKKTYPLFLLFLSTLFYAVHIRPENFLLVFVDIFYLWIALGRSVVSLASRRYILSAACFLILLIPLAQLIYFGAHSSYANAWADSFSAKMAFLMRWLPGNLLYFCSFGLGAPLFAGLAVVGGKRAFAESRGLFYFYLSFFLAFLLVYSSYYIGDMRPLEGGRYSLVLFIPLLWFVIQGIGAVDKGQFPKQFKVILLAALFISFAGHLVSIKPSSNSPHDREYRFILSMRDKLPSDATIISFVPSNIISTIHKKAMNPSYFSGTFSDTRQKFILFKDYWWYAKEKEQQDFMDKLMGRYDLRPIEEKGEYGFYELVLK